MLEYLTILFKLTLCILLGGIIGLERENSNQPAGLRTHIILCVGSGLIMMISIFMSAAYQSDRLVPDPSRIAAQVVSGIGFLGAGAILRFGVSIKGLTTAASLWTTGGIGLAVGCGFYFGAIVSVFIIIVTLTFLRNIQKILLTTKLEKNLNIISEDVKGIIGRIERLLGNYNMRLKNIQVQRSAVKGIVEINAIVTIPAGVIESSVINELTLIPEVSEVELM